MCDKLCGKCTNWKPNGGMTSIGDVYNNPLLSNKLGICTISGKLKNELNGCDVKDMEKFTDEAFREVLEWEKEKREYI